jgi:hypothetical protein
MKITDSFATPGWDGPPIAVLWDQSHVWGLLCIDALSKFGVSFQLLSASEICEDCLDAFRILLVPGGWAAHKVRVLGETGRLKIGKFIDEGGSYIGFCGGAGLALSSHPALHLTPIRRMPLSERLPSASGEIYVRGALSHPAWKDIAPEIPVSVWWPSQFQLEPGCQAASLATYCSPGAGFQVADVRVCDLDEGARWEELEKAYGINLDPARIKAQPAILEIEKGKGRLLLSYAHLETPGDLWGNRLFLNILNYLNDRSATGLVAGTEHEVSEHRSGDRKPEICGTRLPASGILSAKQAAADLIAFGEANLLWNWRNPWLLNWKRGIRGLEYGSLYVMLARLAYQEQESVAAHGPALPYAASAADWPERASRLEEKTLEFCTLAKRLLLEEKIAALTGTVSKLGKVNERVDSLRSSLFGNEMNHGGLCSALFDLIDGMLLDSIRAGGTAEPPGEDQNAQNRACGDNSGSLPDG